MSLHRPHQLTIVLSCFHFHSLPQTESCWWSWYVSFIMHFFILTNNQMIVHSSSFPYISSPHRCGDSDARCDRPRQLALLHAYQDIGGHHKYLWKIPQGTIPSRHGILQQQQAAGQSLRKWHHWQDYPLHHHIHACLAVENCGTVLWSLCTFTMYGYETSGKECTRTNCNFLSSRLRYYFCTIKKLSRTIRFRPQVGFLPAIEPKGPVKPVVSTSEQRARAAFESRQQTGASWI